MKSRGKKILIWIMAKLMFGTSMEVSPRILEDDSEQLQTSEAASEKEKTSSEAGYQMRERKHIVCISIIIWK